MQRIRVCLTLTFTFSLIAFAASASAQPGFVNGLLIAGDTLDATKQPGANAGRLGFFSDLYYDPIRDEWWALSDRGPGGGLLDYATRLQQITLKVNTFTGEISRVQGEGDRSIHRLERPVATPLRTWSGFKR